MYRDYSIWYLEYGYLEAFPQALTMMGNFSDEKGRLSHGYYYLESGDHKVMVDTGWSYVGENKKIADFWGLKNFKRVDEVLGQLGVSGAEIDTVLLTHAHFDHAANMRAFPNAVFYLQEHEYIESCRTLRLPKRFSGVQGAVQRENLEELLSLYFDGRLDLVDGVVNDVLPGIDLYPAFETHSPGHQYIVIRNSEEELPWVCCGDLVMNYENLTGRGDDGVYVPILNGGGAHGRMVEVYDEMMQKVDFNAHRILPQHEPSIVELYPSAEWAENLHIVEIHLRNGDVSRLPMKKR